MWRIFGSRVRDLPTPEERYRAATPASSARVQMDARNARYAAQQNADAAQAAEDARWAPVVRPGTMHREGPSLVLSGWQWASTVHDAPSGRVVYGGRIGGLSALDLHTVAVGHGPQCRCGILRSQP